MKKAIKEIFKRYNGSAVIYKPSKVSTKSIHEICNTVKLAKGLTISKLIRHIRLECI